MSGDWGLGKGVEEFVDRFEWCVVVCERGESSIYTRDATMTRTKIVTAMRFDLIFT